MVLGALCSPAPSWDVPGTCERAGPGIDTPDPKLPLSMGAAGPVDTWGPRGASVSREPLSLALRIPAATARALAVDMAPGRRPALEPKAFCFLTVVPNAEATRPACFLPSRDGGSREAVGPVACVGATGFPSW